MPHPWSGDQEPLPFLEYPLFPPYSSLKVGPPFVSVRWEVKELGSARRMGNWIQGNTRELLTKLPHRAGMIHRRAKKYWISPSRDLDEAEEFGNTRMEEMDAAADQLYLNVSDVGGEAGFYLQPVPVPEERYSYDERFGSPCASYKKFSMSLAKLTMDWLHVNEAQKKELLTEVAGAMGPFLVSSLAWARRERNRWARALWEGSEPHWVEVMPDPEDVTGVEMETVDPEGMTGDGE
jgi:hypothetical protein